MEIVKNRKKGDPVRHAGDVSETVAKVKWTREDAQILCQMIEAIDSAELIECFEVETFLYYCATMVSKGPRDFVDIVRPATLRWIHSLPECRDSFAPLNAEDRPARDQVLSTLAYLAAKMVLKEKSEHDETLTDWVILNRVSCPFVAIGNMMFLGAVLGARVTGITGISVMNAVESLLLRAWQLPGVPAEENKVLAQTLRQFALLVDHKGPYSIYEGRECRIFTVIL